jgi:RimJ/RimL family protein N-acetyltransferase
VPIEPLQVTVEALRPSDWATLRATRLRALKDSPSAFAGLYHVESAWGETEWRAAFVQRTWFVATTPEAPRPVGLAREFRIPDLPEERHIESMWVDPDHRGRRVATAIVNTILARLDPWVTTVSLRVLDGNDLARTVYERLGFRSTGDTSPLWLDADVLRFEERLTRTL